MNRRRVQFALLAKKQRDLMMKLIELHMRFVEISGQLHETDEFGLLTALAKILRPSLDVRTIQSVDWVIDSAGERTVLWIQFFTADLYPANETTEIPVKDVPKAVLEEFDRLWENISRKPWIPPRKRPRRHNRDEVGNVIEIPKRS